MCCRPDTPSEKGANKQQQQQLNPQPGTFAAAWYTVYVAMGLASWLIWKHGGLQAQALRWTLYVAQLCLNITAWPPVFVGGHTRRYAIVDAAGMWFFPSTSCVCIASALCAPSSLCGKSHPNAGYITENKAVTVSRCVQFLKPGAYRMLDQCISALSAALFGTSFATMASFYRVHQAAGLLMLPYLCWACYATAAINWSLRGSNQTPHAHLTKQAERPVAQAAPQSDAQSVVHSEATTPPSGPTSAPTHPNSALPSLYKPAGKTGSRTDTMQNINTELAAGIVRTDPFAGQVAPLANCKQFVEPQHAQGTHSTDQVQPPSTPEKPSGLSEHRGASDTPPQATHDQGLAEPQAATEHADNPQGGVRGLANSARSVQTEENPIAEQTATNPRDLDTSVQTDSISPSFFSDPGANGVQLRDADYLDGKKKVCMFVCLSVCVHLCSVCLRPQHKD